MYGNYEFLAYVVQILVLAALVALTYSRTRFPIWLLGLLSVWFLMHVAGGGVNLGDRVLYQYHFFHVWSSGADYVLKYDQVVHFYGFFTSTLVCWWLLVPQMRPGARVSVIAGIAALAGQGLGAVNEVVEFIAYALLPATGVGGYVNTAINLCANGLGAVTAAVLVVCVRKVAHFGSYCTCLR